MFELPGFTLHPRKRETDSIVPVSVEAKAAICAGHTCIKHMYKKRRGGCFGEGNTNP